MHRLRRRLIVLCGALAVSLSAVPSVARAETAAAATADPRVGPHARDEQTSTRATTPPAGPGPASTSPTRSTSAPLALTAPATPAKEVFGFAPYWALGNWSQWRTYLLSTVAYFGITLDGTGSIVNDEGVTGWNSSNLTNLVSAAHAAGDRVLVTVKCFDEAQINSIVATGAYVDNAVNNAVNLARQRGLDGVDVDFEGYGSSQYPNLRTQFTNFMGTMTARVHAAIPNSEVVADTYASSASSSSGMFDVAGLASNTDALYVMAYDMNPSGVTAATAPLNGGTYNDTTIVQQYVAQAGAAKVILGVPYYGYKWSVSAPGETVPTMGGQAAATYADSRYDFSCAQSLSIHWNATAATHWASWYSPAANDPCGGNYGSWREVYYEDPDSLSAKYDLVNQSGIRGTGPWALGYDSGYDDLWNTIAAKLNVGHNLGGGSTAPVVAANSTPSGPAAAGVEGTDGGLWVTPGGGAGFAPWGGQLTAAPALAWVPAPGGGGRELAVVTGTDKGLWVSAGSGWQPLGPAGTWCADNPAVTVTGPPGSTLLSVGCRGADGALWVAQTPVGSATLPHADSFASYGGVLTAGPAVAWSAGIVTFAVTGAGGAVWTRTSLSPWTQTPWTCSGQPALEASDQVAYFGCQGSDRQLWYAVNSGGGWSPAMAAGGALVGGPGLASAASGVVAFVEGVDLAVHERALGPGGPAGSGYGFDGGTVSGGGGAGAS